MEIAYSVVVATLNRTRTLRLMLESLARQTQLPVRLVLVDASDDETNEKLSRDLPLPFPIDYRRSPFRSAAKRRNEGASNVSTPLIAFMDDDIVLEPGTMAELLAEFSGPKGDQVGESQAACADQVTRSLKAFCGGTIGCRQAMPIRSSVLDCSGLRSTLSPVTKSKPVCTGGVVELGLRCLSD
jgi:glycosyltransferase involved in cell wall biosynthesis